MSEEELFITEQRIQKLSNKQDVQLLTDIEIVELDNLINKREKLKYEIWLKNNKHNIEVLPYISNEEENNVIVKFSPFTNLPIYLTINDTTYKLNEVEKLSDYYTRR